MAMLMVPPILLPKPPPQYSAISDDLRGIDSDHLGHDGSGALRRLGRRMDVELAVLPVRHAAPGLERVMRLRLMINGLVEGVVRVRERLVDVVADRPLGVGRAHGKLVLGFFREILGGPLDLLDLVPILEGVSSVSGIGTARPQALERIDDERKGLEIDLDLLDGEGRRVLVDRRDREDGLALVHRLVGEGSFVERAVGRRKIIGGEDGLHAFHRERRAGVEASYPRVGHGTQQELGEEHPLSPEILRVTGFPRHFGDEIRW